MSKGTTIGDLADNNPKENRERVEKLEEKIKNIYLDLFQVVAIIIAIITLMIGNLVGFNIISLELSLSNLIGFILLINGTILLSIAFLVFLLKFLFMEKEWKKFYKYFILSPVLIQIIGIFMIYFIK
ncbi:MAG: hypothetical protein ACQER0_09000 [Bacillota bacterium]